MGRPTVNLQSAVTLLAGTLILIVAVWPLVPPPPVGSDADAADFSAVRAIEHVEAIAVRPHPMGSSEIEEVRGYLTDQLTALGLAVERQVVDEPDFFGMPGNTVEVANVMARIEGSDSSGAVALVAHHDTHPDTPGANDNSAAVAAVLETGRALLAGPQLAHDVILLFTDGEEPSPRFGSGAFVAEHPWFAEIEVVVNLEAVGGSGPSLLTEVTGPEPELIRALASAVEHPTAFSFVDELVELIGGSNTDLAPFRDAGVPGYEFAYMYGSPIYHTSRDNLDGVGLRSLQDHGQNTLGLARYFAGVEPTAVDGAGTVVYFTLGPSWMITYPGWFGLVVSLFAALLLGLAIVRRRPPLLGDALRSFGGVLIGSFSATLLWLLIVRVRTTPGLIESYAYLIGLVVLAWLVHSWVARRSARPVGPPGVLLIWVALALVTSWLIPGVGYLFVWPALAGLATWWLTAGRGNEQRPVGPGIPLALVTALVMVPAVDFFFQLAMPRPGNLDSQIPATVLVSVFLGVLSVSLLQTARTR